MNSLPREKTLFIVCIQYFVILVTRKVSWYFSTAVGTNWGHLVELKAC